MSQSLEFLSRPTQAARAVRMFLRSELEKIRYDKSRQVRGSCSRKIRSPLRNFHLLRSKALPPNVRVQDIYNGE